MNGDFHILTKRKDGNKFMVSQIGHGVIFSNYSGVASQFDLLNCLKCLENVGKPLTAILASILSTILSGPFSCKVIYLHIYIYIYTRTY